MAITLKIEVVEVRQQDVAQKGTHANSSFSSRPEDLDTIKEQQADNKEMRFLKATSAAAFGLAMQSARSYIHYKLAGIKFDTGDSNYAASAEEHFNDAMFWVKSSIAVVGSLGAGFAVGGIPGAILGGITSISSIGIGQLSARAEFDREYNFNAKIDAFNVNYNKARSGTNVYGGGRLR